MSPTIESAAPATTQRVASALRRFAISALYALVLLVPELLHLRRNPRSWLAFRFALGLFGPALVLLPLGFQYAWLFSIAGVAMFLAAFLLPPARPDTRVPDKARELGARAVVDGGSYQPSDDRPAAVRLFVGRETISALDTSLRPLLVIPTAEIYSVRAFPNEGHWILRVEWADPAPASGGCSAEFSYRGFFAEHLARIALSALKSVLRAPSSDFQQQTQDLQSRTPAGRGKAAGA